MDKSSFAKENVEKLINRKDDKKIDIAALLKNPEVQELVNGFMAAKGAGQLAKTVTAKAEISTDDER